MELNGVTLEFDYYDADQLERLEKGILEVQEGCGSLPEGLKLSESIRRQCGLVFAFFDGVFGEGTARRVFGPSANLMACLDAFEAVVEEIQRQQKKLLQRQRAYLGEEP